MGTPNWAELIPDILQCVFERLSFASLKQAKLVCSSWYYVAKGCVPNQNQIPWLVLFPPKENRCLMYVPEDNKLYSSGYLGVEFAQSDFLRSCGSWLLMLNVAKNLYIVNPFTGERVDLPVGHEIIDPRGIIPREIIAFDDKPCFWIDNKTKDYIVVLPMYKKFTKKGFNNWQDIDTKWCEDVFYDHKKQKLYVHFFEEDNNGLVDIWDFSGDMPHLDESVSLPWFRFHLPDPPIGLPFYERKTKSNIVVTVSGDILIVSRISKDWEPHYFRIYKRNEVGNKWEDVNFLGDEALIYDLSITVTANSSIRGIKRNSIYFSSRVDDDANDIFVYDINMDHQKRLPQRILSSLPPLTKARWFFPC